MRRLQWFRHAWRPRRDDSGAAVIEFIFLGVLTLVPLFYVTIAFFGVQSQVFATSWAAREAGRLFATAADVPTGVYRAQYGVRLAYQNIGADDEGTQLRFVSLDTPCDAGGPVAPDPGVATLEPGAQFAVCVIRNIDFPGVPGFLEGESNTIEARYEVYVDDFADRRVAGMEGNPGGVP